jgi:hypothetical protein
MTKMSRRLVIDASVLSCASEKQHPISSACRVFLQEVLSICHKAVLTQDIDREWKDHYSHYSLLWAAAMRGKRKLALCEPTQSLELEEAMAAEALGDAQKDAVRKDALLVEAALEADMAIISLDEIARRLYQRLAKHIPRLRTLVWVNPVREDDEPIEWLKAGARLEQSRRLGSPGMATTQAEDGRRRRPPAGRP